MEHLAHTYTAGGSVNWDDYFERLFVSTDFKQMPTLWPSKPTHSMLFTLMLFIGLVFPPLETT